MSSTPQTSERASRIKRKQMIALGVIGTVIAVIAMAATYFFDKKSRPMGDPRSQAQAVPLATGGATYNEAEAWRTQVGADVNAMQRQIRELAANQGKAQPAPTGPDLTLGAVPPPVAKSETPAPPKAPAASSETRVADAPKLKDLGDLPPAPPQRKPGEVPARPTAFDPPGTAQGVVAPPKSLIKSLNFEAPPAKEKQAPKGDDQSLEGTYIPRGTFARAVLMSGMKAPTGGQSQSNPSPLQLRIIEPVRMPNGYEADLTGCIVMGNAMGSLESESAKIRLDGISCIDGKEQAYDVAIRGYIAGEDGIEGMSGTVVTKTGQMMGNALMASIGSGIGEAFRSASETQSTSVFGTTTTNTNPGEGFTRGFGAGTQRAFDLLAKYYITLAEKTYPVVEVQPGRVVDIVFQSSIEFKARPK